MKRICSALLAAALISGCNALRKDKGADAEFRNPRSESSIGAPPAFALPGVPLRSELEQQLPRRDNTAAAKPAEQPKPAESAKTAAQPKPAPVKTAPQAAVEGTRADFEFHLSEARRYSSKKKHLSAAAEYKAAMRFIPSDDPMTVHLIERQGAMMLRAGNTASAKEQFQAAIAKAGNINLKNDDLANSYLGLGYCNEIARQIPEAISNYENVMKFSTNKMIRGRVASTIEDLKKK